MIDVDPDEAVDLARKSRMLHWDPRKKKYIKTSLQELGESKKHKVCNNEERVRVTGVEMSFRYSYSRPPLSS